MHRIDWEDSKKKGEAYAYLAKVFEVKKPAVSLAMSFKRNSLKAHRSSVLVQAASIGKLWHSE